MITEKHRVAAFDFDDCLVATIKNVWNQHKHVASTVFGVTLTNDDLRAVWGRPFPLMVETLYGHPFAEVEPHLIAVKPQFPKEIFPGSMPLLKGVKAANKVVAIVTSTNTRSIAIDLELNRMGPDIVDHVFTVDDCEFHKPDPRVFDPLLALGYQPEEVVYAGDAATDFYAARDAGFDFIGVATGLLSVEDFAALEGWKTSGAVAVASVADISYT